MSTKLFRASIIAIILATVAIPAVAQEADEVVKALKTIDPAILQYFPRWKVCEPDLQVQVKQTFALMGYDPASLDETNITITAAPVNSEVALSSYDLILVECGSAKMVAAEIASYMKKLAIKISDKSRPYCFTEVPTTQPPSAPQAAEIMNFMEPTNVTHAFTISAFEQSLKIGNSGFWLKSSIGTDQVGYTYWSSGEARVQLQRPLYVNDDIETRNSIRYLLNARLGFGYRITGSMEGQDRLLDFVPGRRLNAGSGGKIVAGLDYHMPFYPSAGVAMNLEIPLKGISSNDLVDPATFHQFDIGTRNVTAPGYEIDPISTAALLRSTGQLTAFYNLWFGENGPENFVRLDLGLNYAEVREVGVFNDTANSRKFLAYEGVRGLQLWKPSEVGDWVYAKAEYRNQGSYPFGVSVQYSNQIIMARTYLPLLGDWLYLEGRYSTPLRGLRPFEHRNFFMISPVLRLNF